ncbi:leucine-rich repeat domain-containing protein [Bacillus sp. FJAT-49711]|uniref:leucine-rich repeat domain-containing protein n=1 Tax=Bacillus sp. FJAT-49711 TaxID=2833585 RepID=UPI001BCA35AA|nr:leucine-rich repeat domain-containing protein [Bacillus sp. FJAT-49711]MBS4220330.1 leucine-rich repeat domain-containing protein [Bacillus sp. FJAT-49711]
MKKTKLFILVLTIGFIVQFGFTAKSINANEEGTNAADQVNTEVAEDLEPSTDIVDSNITEEIEGTSDSEGIEDTGIKFNDENLAQAIYGVLGKWENITEEDLLTITDLYSSRGISDLSGIEYLKNLNYLSLGNSSIKDFTPLAQLKKLESLDISNNGVSDLSSIGKLTSLKMLRMAGNSVTDLSAIGKLTKLEVLDASNNELSNLSGLAKLTNLKELYLSGNKVSDVSPLANIKNLTSIMLNDNNISDISKLGKLSNLQSVDVSNNKVTNIEVLSILPKLNYVNIEKNPLNLNQGSPAIQIVQALMKKDAIVLHDAIVVLITKKVTKDTISVEWDISEKHLSFGNGYYEIRLSLDGKQVKTFHDLKDTEYTFTGLEKGKKYEVGIQLEFGLINRSHVITKTLNVKPEEIKTSQQTTIKPTITGNVATISYDDINSVGENGVLQIDLKDQQEAHVSLTSAQIKMLQENNITVEINKGDAAVKIPAHLLGNGKDVKILMERKKPEKGALSAVYDFTIETDEGNISNFSEPVTLMFTVDKSKVKNDENMKVWYFNPETKEWENIGGSYSNGFVTAETNHFSTYAVFEEEEATDGTGTESEIDSENEPGTGPKTESEIVSGSKPGTRPITESESGNVLPNTSTHMMNFLIIGVIFILLGSVLIWFQKRKETA